MVLPDTCTWLVEKHMPEISKATGKGAEEIKTARVNGKQELLEERIGIFMSIMGSCASLWDLDGIFFH